MVRTSGINPARRCSSHSSWLYTEYALPTCCLVVPDSKIAKKALNAPKRPRKASDDLNDFTNSNNDACSPAVAPGAAEQSGLDDGKAQLQQGGKKVMLYTGDDEDACFCHCASVCLSVCLSACLSVWLSGSLAGWLAGSLAVFVSLSLSVLCAQAMTKKQLRGRGTRQPQQPADRF